MYDVQRQEREVHRQQLLSVVNSCNTPLTSIANERLHSIAAAGDGAEAVGAREVVKGQGHSNRKLKRR